MDQSKRLNKDPYLSSTGTAKSGAPERNSDTIDSHLYSKDNFHDRIDSIHPKTDQKVITGSSIRPETKS
jgi:hypothetical protein